MTANPLSPLTPNGAPPPAPTAPTGPSRFTPLDPVRILRQYIWWIGAAAVLGLTVGVITWYMLSRYQSEYTSDAQILVTPGVQSPYESPLVPMEMRGEALGSYMVNLTIRIRSDEILGDALKRPEIRETRWFQSFPRTASGEPDARLARKDLQDNLSAGQVRGATLIGLSLSGQFPDSLPVILDGVIATFLQHVEVDQDTNLSKVRKQMTKERDDAQNQIEQIQQQLKTYAIQNDLPNLKDRNTEAFQSYQFLIHETMELRHKVEEARDGYESMAKQYEQGTLVPSVDELAEVQSAPTVAGRDDQIRNLREEREIALNKYGEKHRYIIEIDQRMAGIEQEKKREMERIMRERQQYRLTTSKHNLDGLEAQLAVMEPKLEEARTRVRELNLKFAEYERIEENIKTTQERKNKAEEVLNDIRVGTSREDNDRVRQVVFATGAELTFPKMGSIVSTSTMMFVGIVTGLIFLKELLDQRIKSPADLRLLPAAELLGVLPQTTEDPSGPAAIEGVVRKDPTGLMAESFRQVRTALLSRVDRRGYKTLLLVGAQSGTGVSAVVSNLAASLAYNGRRVAVLDANFRRPSQHRLFDTPLQPGLVEVLAGSVTLEQALVHREDPAVDVLPVGDAHASSPEILESAAFRALLRRLEGEYDLVLIDAPPALLSSEAQLMAKQVDAIAFVIRAMQDKRGMVGRMMRQLDGHRADILGVIINGVRSSAGGYFRKSYQEFYRYRKPGGGSAAARRAAKKTAASEVEET